MSRHFIHIQDLGAEGAAKMLARAREMKERSYRADLLEGKNIVLIFEKPSTRTRLSFEVAVRELGGQTIFMTPAESQLGRAEPLRDTARVISRYCDGMVVRTFGEAKLAELIRHSGVPVINALTDEGHPCQVMGDLLTIYERTPDFSRLRVAWIGDCNNMAWSWMEAAAVFPFELSMAFPPGYVPAGNKVSAYLRSGAKISITGDPRQAARGAHYINTDVWASMGQEDERAAREKAFKGFCVDAGMMSLAAPEAKFMHCLPAHRGEEVTEEVMEGAQSIIFDQAENRLHIQKAILEWAFSGGK
ncbi:MAG: ornithine carbamoyltransferase [Deltaproteobacteria bacterium]|jgi:ornithine carbamoyltransferase|nr:ornithine carbamoyltransferase [Deltaproteobacteria bacterium]